MNAIIKKTTFKELLFTDNSKPVEKQGRKAIGPVKWQPVTNTKYFFLLRRVINFSFKLLI
jgi:hypothetical protein